MIAALDIVILLSNLKFTEKQDVGIILPIGLGTRPTAESARRMGFAAHGLGAASAAPPPAAPPSSA